MTWPAAVLGIAFLAVILMLGYMVTCDRRRDQELEWLRDVLDENVADLKWEPPQNLS